MRSCEMAAVLAPSASPTTKATAGGGPLPWEWAHRPVSMATAAVPSHRAPPPMLRWRRRARDELRIEERRVEMGKGARAAGEGDEGEKNGVTAAAAFKGRRRREEAERRREGVSSRSSAQRIDHPLSALMSSGGGCARRAPCRLGLRCREDGTHGRLEQAPTRAQPQPPPPRVPAAASAPAARVTRRASRVPRRAPATARHSRPPPPRPPPPRRPPPRPPRREGEGVLPTLLGKDLPELAPAQLAPVDRLDHVAHGSTPSSPPPTAA